MTTTTVTLVLLSLAACAPPPPAAVQLPDEQPIASADLLSAPPPADMRPASSPDMTPEQLAPDMLQCGKEGWPCCPGFACEGAVMRCLVDFDVCGDQQPHICRTMEGCGSNGLPPCNDDGMPYTYGR